MQRAPELPGQPGDVRPVDGGRVVVDAPPGPASSAPVVRHRREAGVARATAGRPASVTARFCGIDPPQGAAFRVAPVVQLVQAAVCTAGGQPAQAQVVGAVGAQVASGHQEHVGAPAEQQRASRTCGDHPGSASGRDCRRWPGRSSSPRHRRRPPRCAPPRPDRRPGRSTKSASDPPPFSTAGWPCGDRTPGPAVVAGQPVNLDGHTVARVDVAAVAVAEHVGPAVDGARAPGDEARPVDRRAGAVHVPSSARATAIIRCGSNDSRSVPSTAKYRNSLAVHGQQPGLAHVPAQGDGGLQSPVALVVAADHVQAHLTAGEVAGGGAERQVRAALVAEHIQVVAGVPQLHADDLAQLRADRLVCRAARGRRPGPTSSPGGWVRSRNVADQEGGDE